MAKATIKDVARLAAVSPSTVSNVINGINKCSEDTRNKILDAMTELNYKPNLTAKSLVQKKSNLIGLVYNSDSYNSYEDTLKGVEFRIRSYEEYDFLITAFRDSNQISDWILKRNLDGLILLGDFDSNIISYIRSLGKPIVSIDNYRDSIDGVSYINSEDTLGAYKATEHFIQAGSKKPYIVTGNLMENELSNRRYLGYLSCLEDYGIEYTEDMLIEIPKEDYLQGKLVASRIHAIGAQSILCTQDIVAIGILKSLFMLGVKCPEDIKLIGFENITGSEFTNPSLTTVDTGAFQKGEEAIDTVVKLIEKVEVKNINLSIETKIIKRETT